MARATDPTHAISYHVADLSQPLRTSVGPFDCIGSYLALNDVADHRGFAATLVAAARPGARVVLALNNPYAAVVRRHIVDYFANGAMGMYTSFARQGIPAHYYHRTLEAYLDAFLGVGFRLVKLADVTDQGGSPWLLPRHFIFPRFLILAFDAPAESVAGAPGSGS